MKIMNRLYYLLILLSLTWLTACDEGGTENVYLQQQDSSFAVTGVCPAEGYIGGQFTITGTDFGGSKELLKVYIGDFQCELITCTDEKLVVQIPEEAVTGKILLKVVKKMVDSGYTFTVLDNPILVPENTEGYLNGELMFTCSGMPVTSEHLEVAFGELKAEILSESYEMDESGSGTMVVKIPNRLSVGATDITVNLFGREIYKEKYTILPTPSITSGNKLTTIGATIIFTGEGFEPFSGEGKVKVDFNGTEVVPESVTATSIAVKVPDGFDGGEVFVKIEGIPDIEAGMVHILKPSAEGDITAQVLQNSTQPFAPTNGSTPDGWIFNDKFTGPALEWSKDVVNGLILLQSGWACPVKENAKMYQIVSLPAGTYKFKLSIVECGSNSGNFGASFVMAKGKAAIPDLSKQSDGTWKLSDESNVLGSCSIVDTWKEYDGLTSVSCEMEATLTEETEVTIGFVTQMTGQGWVKLSSVEVKWVE